MSFLKKIKKRNAFKSYIYVDWWSKLWLACRVISFVCKCNRTILFIFWFILMGFFDKPNQHDENQLIVIFCFSSSSSSAISILGQSKRFIYVLRNEYQQYHEKVNSYQKSNSVISYKWSCMDVSHHHWTDCNNVWFNLTISSTVRAWPHEIQFQDSKCLINEKWKESKQMTR